MYIINIYIYNESLLYILIMFFFFIKSLLIIILLQYKYIPYIILMSFKNNMDIKF